MAYPLNMDTLAHRLRVALEQAQGRAKSQADLARACGVSPAAVTQWMHGDVQTIRWENLAKAADALGVQVQWLATGGGPMFAETATTPQKLDELSDDCSSPNSLTLASEEREILLAFRRLPSHLQLCVLPFIKKLLQASE